MGSATSWVRMIAGHTSATTSQADPRGTPVSVALGRYGGVILSGCAMRKQQLLNAAQAMHYDECRRQADRLALRELMAGNTAINHPDSWEARVENLTHELTQQASGAPRPARI